MKILILGGTGYIGPCIVESALKNEHTLTLFNRGKTNPGLFPDLEKLHGDREKRELDALNGRKWDAAIDTRTDKPRLVKEALEVLAPNIGHFLFISSVSVYKDISVPALDESSPTLELADPTVEDLGASYENYGGLKALCEKTGESMMPGHFTSVRPHLIVGPNDPSDRFTYWPVRVARGGEVLAPGDPSTPVQFIDVRDLGDFVVRLIEDGHAGIYNAAGPKYRLTMQELLHGCKTVCASDASFTWVDETFLAGQSVSPWREMPIWIGSGGPGIVNVNHDRAMAHGLAYRSPADTIRDTLAWEKTRERDHKWKAGIDAENEAKVLAAWRAREKK